MNKNLEKEKAIEFIGAVLNNNFRQVAGDDYNRIVDKIIDDVTEDCLEVCEGDYASISDSDVRIATGRILLRRLRDTSVL